LRDRPTRVIEEWGDEGMKLLLILVALQLAGCAAVPELVGAKHHCDPSNDEQFKQNASWDARTQDEYLVERVRSGSEARLYGYPPNDFITSSDDVRRDRCGRCTAAGRATVGRTVV
jgi:hypothetical protein